MIQFHDEFAVTVRGVMVMEGDEPQCIIGQDLISFREKHFRKKGERSEADSGFMQLEVGPKGSGVCYDVKMFTIDDDVPAGGDSDAMCMAVLAKSLEKG